MLEFTRRIRLLPRCIALFCSLTGLAALQSIVPRLAVADPVPGFIEHWTSSAFGSWGGGSESYSNPFTGGERGVGDGFLIVGNTTPFNLGAQAQG